jgi:transposase
MTSRRGATVFCYFKQWRADGTVDRIHDALRDRVRDVAGRDPMASAGIVDAQSVKAADTARVRRGQESQRP